MNSRSLALPFAADDVPAWRKSERARLIARREALLLEERRTADAHITELLVLGFPLLGSLTIGFYWPFKGEVDPRLAVRRFRARGARGSLPVVVEKGAPLQFREWTPGCVTRPGAFGLPIPVDGAVVVPDVVMVPPVGFGTRGYRLGYGGGYFDRTLAALERRVLAVGVSYEALRLPTIYPQPHDIPMDFVVTEAGIRRAGGNPLALLEPAAAAAEAASLMQRRGLPRQRGEAVAEGGYASPACSAHEIAPDYFGATPPTPAHEIVALLNGLLEAERAGAKVLAAFMEEYPRDTPAWRQLAVVQRDEAKNCAILIDLVQRLGGTPSAATGDFLGKALAVEGKAARLQFLNRGQGWVARHIGDALPGIREEFVRSALSAMRDSHLLNIELCGALAETLDS